MSSSQKYFGILFEIPFSNRLKVFYLHLQSPSELQHVTNGHVFALAKYPAVREATGKLESLLLSQWVHTCLHRLFFQSNDEDTALSFWILILQGLTEASCRFQLNSRHSLSLRKQAPLILFFFLRIPLRVFYSCLELESNGKSVAFHNRKLLSRNGTRGLEYWGWLTGTVSPV